MSAIAVMTVFTACSANTESDEPSTHATNPVIETKEAKIKENEALRFIKQAYSKEELGLDKITKDYTFMVASSGVDIEGTKYIKVVANVIVKNDETTKDGKETFSMETIGEYYISFDGKKVLKKDMKTDKYTELENRYDAFKQKADKSEKADKSTSKTK